MSPNAQHRAEVTPSRSAQSTQIIQGAYYVIAGGLVALGVHSFQRDVGPPADASSDLWFVRVLGLCAAVFGVALVMSGRRAGGPFLSAWVGMWTAFLIGGLEVIGMGLDVLPHMFLIDTVAQFGFAAWWVVTMFSRVDTEIDRSTPLPSGS